MADADLRGSSFVRTSFAAANLQRTRFDDVSIIFGVDFTDAAMPAAHFEGANLREATGLVRDNLSTVFIDAKTFLPDGLDPRGTPGYLESQAMARKWDTAGGGWREMRRGPALVVPPTKADNP